MITITCARIMDVYKKTQFYGFYSRRCTMGEAGETDIFDPDVTDGGPAGDAGSAA